MAKRGILTHPKTLLLADLLSIQEPFAVGILECLWQWVSDHYPSGDLSGVRGTLIARGIRYSGDAAQLVEALVESRLLDRTGDRVVVHDWSEHANDAVHLRLARAGQTFADGSTPSTKRMSKGERALLVRTEGARKSHDVPTGSAPPSPPLPSPPLLNESAAPPPPRKNAAKEGPKETPEETAARKAAIGAWVSRFPEAKAPGARIWSALKPLVAAHGWSTVGPNWTRYLAEQDPQFSNPQSYAAKYPWTGNGKRVAGHQTAPTGETEYGPWGIRPKMPELPQAPPPPKVNRPDANPEAAEVWNRVVGAVECSPYQRETWLAQAIPVGMEDPNIVRIWATASVRDHLRGTMREAVKSACEAHDVRLVFTGVVEA